MKTPSGPFEIGRHVRAARDLNFEPHGVIANGERGRESSFVAATAKARTVIPSSLDAGTLASLVSRDIDLDDGESMRAKERFPSAVVGLGVVGTVATLGAAASVVLGLVVLLVLARARRSSEWQAAPRGAIGFFAEGRSDQDAR